MIHFKNKFYVSLALGGLLALTSCSEDENPVTNEEENNAVTEQYVIASSDTENTYLLTTEKVSEGSISPQNTNSTQVLGTPIWYFFKDQALFSFVYRKGDPGTTKSFVLNDQGELEVRNEIDLQVSMQSKAIIGDEIYLQYSSRNYAEPAATFYKINGNTEVVSGPFTINTEELAGNGETAYLTDIAGYKDYILVGYQSINAGENGGETWTSTHYDHTYVGVYTKDFEFVKRIEDTGRTGFVAGQSRSQGETGIEPVENGDVYVFSSAMGIKELPSGVLKINNGTLAFDKDYFFNISEASGGYKLYRTHYLGENTFVLRMFTEKNTASGSPADTRFKFAVVNVVDKTFDWVTGVPDGILSIGVPYVNKKDNEVVFPIETSLYPTLYTIDANTASMTSGKEVVAEGVQAVGRLSIQN